MTTYHVSASGDLTIQQAIDRLQAGDILELEGSFFGAVKVEGKHGSREHPIVIRSAPGAAVLEGCSSRFAAAGNDEWKPAKLTDPKAHEDEYVSTRRITVGRHDQMNRGAFFRRQPYTRLITYAKLEDLRAENQTWGERPLSERHGWQVVRNGTVEPFKYPWVYMGPGLFFERGLVPARDRIHIRLSHTRNAVNGFADYDGETDPRRLPLAISNVRSTTLLVHQSSFVRFENIVLRFGGEATVKVTSSTDIVFDHVRVFAATNAITLNRTLDTVLGHCEIYGGVPTWYFRSDRKGEYDYVDGGSQFHNELGKRTSQTVLNSAEDNGNLEIHHCELVDGHDLVLSGNTVRFHHNWVHNLNDEALIVDKHRTVDLRIYQNAITQVLSAISFNGMGGPGGPRFVYRNLFDLRNPTASRRPEFPGDPQALRSGHLYKGGDPNQANPVLGEDGPLDLFQNTFLVRGVDDRHASYTLYENTRDQHPRRSFNNIFIAVNPDRGSDLAIAILPPSTFPAATDGNCYFRIGHAAKPLLRVLQPTGRFFNDLAAWQRDPLFTASQAQYLPGYEAAAIDVNPQFQRIVPDGAPHPEDDFRLRGDSPALNAGLPLEAPLSDLDPRVADEERPDIGCYPFDALPLRTGVEGRRRFPGGLRPLPPTI